MQAVTIREAKARLNALVEAASRGEQVVLMRGSKHVAAIVPISAADLEIAARLSDTQAERLWAELAGGLRDGSSVLAESPERAVDLLRRRGVAAARSRRTRRPRR